jgi:hypothetical protein
MRLLPQICCIAMVVTLSPAFAQTAIPSEAQPPVDAARLAEPAIWQPPARVGRVSLVSGTVALHRSEDTGWADAEPNQPLFIGESARTGPRARSEIGIGANTISLSDATEMRLANLQERSTPIELLRGRIGFRLRQIGDG